MDVLRASNIGAPVTIADSRSGAAMAYFDAARRLAGEDLPITMPGERRNIFDKLFGRRAA
jgi:septum site-determining protein MinD